MNKILLPTDFTPLSRHAIYYIGGVINKLEIRSSIDLLHAYWVHESNDEEIIESHDRSRTESKAALERECLVLKSILLNKNLQVQTHSILGSVQNVILQRVKEHGHDLIVMTQDEGKKIREVSLALHKAKINCPLTTVFSST